MIKIICLGKLKEKYLEDLVNDYLKRITKYHKIEIIELKDENDLSKEAKNIVKKGHFTYEQAKNIAKAGTVESITYDAVNGAIIARRILNWPGSGHAQKERTVL